MAGVFICYSTKHPVYAYLLEDAIRDRFTWFRDQRDLPPGEEWEKYINKEIQQATVLVVIVTEEAIASSQVKREINVAKSFNKPCVSVVMERLQSKGASLSALGLDERQAIDFVPENGLNAGFEQLLNALDRLTDTWAPIEKNIQRLGHFSWIVRQQAVIDLAEKGDIRALDSLIESFEVEDSNDVKQAIVLGMEHFDDERTMKVILSEFAPRIGTNYKDMLNRKLARFPATEGYLVASLPRIGDESLRLSLAYQYTFLDSQMCKDCARTVRFRNKRAWRKQVGMIGL